MVRKRVSTGTSDKVAAKAFADALESSSKAMRSLAGQTITRKHAEGLFLSMLSQAGISVQGSEPLPLLLDFVNGFMDSKERTVAPLSFRNYQQAQRKFAGWLETQGFEDGDLKWMTSERANAYYSHLRERLSVKTAKENFRWLSRIMKKAVIETSLEKNPCDAVTIDTKGETLKRLPFSLEEARQLIEWLCAGDARKREWARLAALSVMSGCRLEDAMKMDLARIKDGVLRYRQTKTGKDIECPLVVPEWLALITEEKEGFVSPVLSAEFAKWSNSKLSTEFTGYVAAAGVEQSFTQFASGRRIARKTFHSLRHTLRTAIVSSGGSDAQADLILGHSEGEGKRYTHSEVDAMRGTLERAFKS